ncbi:MAG TPA: serine/threonine-protein kinase [Gemmataceae bacterium]|nr:serine/threonine-protein kinase [Gemmataceae bacterium]
MSTPSPSESGRRAYTETITDKTRRDPAGLTGEQPTDRDAHILPTIPGFRVVRRIGGGGMGEVYEVVDEKVGVTFALKMIRPDRSGPGFADRFLKEIKAMMVLDHPHIARFFKYGEVDDWPYFTMRYVPGGTLADRRDQLRADPRGAVRLLVKVVDAVEYLHARGKIHRDLKPSNILIDDTGEPLLSDFGLVKDVADMADTAAAESTSGPHGSTDGETRTIDPPVAATPNALTRTGGVVGTYAYMSPEQARGEKGRIGPATDVWALGVILHELVTGHRPGEEPETLPSRPAMTAQAPADPGPADPVLARIIDRCLSEEPAGRYESAGALARDLRSWLGEGAPSAVPVRGRTWRAVAVAAGVALLAVVASVALWKRDKDKDPAVVREEARAWVREELRANRAVELIDADGNARPVFQYLVGEERAKAGREADGWWTVSMTGTARIEFLDDPGVEAFTLKATMRGGRATEFPMAGLYVARRRVAGADGDYDFQLEYLYREAPASFAMPAPGNVAPQGTPPQTKSTSYKRSKQEAQGDLNGLQQFRAFGGRAGQGVGDPKRIGKWTLPPLTPPGASPVRHLAIRADGENFAAVWEDEVVLPRAEILANDLERLQELPGRQPDPPLKFSARGGLGVYVDAGSASFRELIIVPGKSP